jgi:hypothetical protein
MDDLPQTTFTQALPAWDSFRPGLPASDTFRRWALKSIHCPLEEVTSHQRIGHPHPGRVGAHSFTIISPTATLAVYRVST